MKRDENEKTELEKGIDGITNFLEGFAAALDKSEQETPGIKERFRRVLGSKPKRIILTLDTEESVVILTIGAEIKSMPLKRKELSTFVYIFLHNNLTKEDEPGRSFWHYEDIIALIDFDNYKPNKRGKKDSILRTRRTLNAHFRKSTGIDEEIVQRYGDCLRINPRFFIDF